MDNVSFYFRSLSFEHMYPNWVRRLHVSWVCETFGWRQCDDVDLACGCDDFLRRLEFCHPDWCTIYHVWHPFLSPLKFLFLFMVFFLGSLHCDKFLLTTFTRRGEEWIQLPKWLRTTETYSNIDLRDHTILVVDIWVS